MSWKLIAQSAPLAGETIVIDRDMVIGRHQQADIVLQAAHVSRRHAGLSLRDQQLWLEDLGSSNGTQVNGQPVTAPVQLQVGDVISLQDLQFEVQQETAAAPAVQSASDPLTHTDVYRPADDMPTLAARGQDVQLTPEGMPQQIAVPRPAPLPADAEVKHISAEPRQQPLPPPQGDVPSMHTPARQEDMPPAARSSHGGLMSLVVIAVLIALAAIYYFMQH